MKALSLAAIAAVLSSGVAVQPAAAHCRCACPAHHRHAVHRRAVGPARFERTVRSEPVEIIRGPVAPGPYYETPTFEPPLYEAPPTLVYDEPYAYGAPVWYGGYGLYGGGPHWRAGWGHGFHAGFGYGFGGRYWGGHGWGHDGGGHGWSGGHYP